MARRPDVVEPDGLRVEPIIVAGAGYRVEIGSAMSLSLQALAGLSEDQTIGLGLGGGFH